MDRPQPPDLRDVVQGFGRRPGEVVAAGVDLAEAEPDVEVVQGRQGVLAVPDREFGVASRSRYRR
jgi:hypothetical protein